MVNIGASIPSRVFGFQSALRRLAAPVANGAVHTSQETDGTDYIASSYRDFLRNWLLKQTTPVCTPALVKVIAVQPKRNQPNPQAPFWTRRRHLNELQKFVARMRRAREQRTGFVRDIDKLLGEFVRNRVGDVPAANVPRFQVEDEVPSSTTYKEGSRDGSQSISFEVWWPADARGKDQPAGTSDDDLIRVLIKMDWMLDFVLVTFIIDAGVARSGRRFGRGDKGTPETLRSRLLSAAEAVSVEADNKVTSVPQDVRGYGLASNDERRKAAALFYKEVWEKFESWSGLSTRALAGTKGSVFVQYQGLVLSTAGAPSTAGTAAKSPDLAYAPFERFQNNSMNQPHTANEANAVLRAWWGYLREVWSDIDDRDMIASSIFNCRALLIQAGGPKNTLTTSRHSAGPARNDAADAIRYLILVKGIPDSDQIGRMIDRHIEVNVFAAAALQKLPELRIFDRYVEQLGKDLDGVQQDWEANVNEIYDLSDSIKKSWLSWFISPRQKYGLWKNDVDDQRDRAIGLLARQIDQRLLKIGTLLQDQAELGIEHLPFQIGRSRFYFRRMEEAIRSLGITEIDTWLGLEHYVRRGYAPSFELIDRLGHRVKDLRERMLAVLEVVQTSALVAQASATRAHTSLLRVGLVGGLLIGGKFILETFEKLGTLLRGTEFELLVRDGITPMLSGIGSVIARVAWLIVKPALKIVASIASEISAFVPTHLAPLLAAAETWIGQHDTKVGVVVLALVACWIVARMYRRPQPLRPR